MAKGYRGNFQPAVREGVIPVYVGDTYYRPPINRPGQRKVVKGGVDTDGDSVYLLGEQEEVEIYPFDTLFGVQTHGRYPTWAEIEEARTHFIPESVPLAMLLPPKEEYLNAVETQLNLIQLLVPGPNVTAFDLLTKKRELMGYTPSVSKMLPGPFKIGKGRYSLGEVLIKVEQDSRECWSMALYHPSRWPDWDEIVQARYTLIPENVTMGFVAPREPWQPGGCGQMFQIVGGQGRRCWKKDLKGMAYNGKK
jgi:hypothetical protein